MLLGIFERDRKLKLFACLLGFWGATTAAVLGLTRPLGSSRGRKLQKVRVLKNVSPVEFGIAFTTCPVRNLILMFKNF